MANETKYIRELIQKDESGALIRLLLSPLAENVMMSSEAGAKNIKQYVDDLINGLINGAPEALDTLKEIADKLSDNDDAVAGIINTLANKVDKESDKGLSTNDYTTSEKNKLAGIAENANNYTHPASHTANMITQDSTHRFVTDAEKAAWNGRSNIIIASEMPSDAANGTICFVTV